MATANSAKHHLYLYWNSGLHARRLSHVLRDKEFRYFLFANMRYNREILKYWLLSFGGKSQRDQDIQMEAAQTRAEIMLAHPYLRDIVVQSRSTLDFGKLIAEKKIILLKLSSSLSNEAKKIIGTIIISELLSAVGKRAEDRSQFCICVDEFQNYASFEDVSTLITQALSLVLPQQLLITKDTVSRKGKEGEIPTVGIMEGLCLLVRDASFSMSVRAFPDNDLVKLRMVTRAVHRAIVELYDISKPDEAFIGIIAFGARAVLIPDRRKKPFLLTVREIQREFGSDGVKPYRFDVFDKDVPDVNRKWTDMTAASQLARDIYDGAIAGDPVRQRRRGENSRF